MEFSILELGMLVCFGVSWPFSVIRSYKARTAQGKSIIFLILLFLAYTSGILHKVITSLDIVLVLYAFNFVMVSMDIVLYIRNTKLDKLKGQTQVKGE